MPEVTDLVVTPSAGGVSLSYLTDVAVRGQLQIGTASGDYPMLFTLETAPVTSHSASGYGLTPGTAYHYVIQFYDHLGTAVEATDDATFTTATATPGSGSEQLSTVNGPPAGSACSINTANGDVEAGGDTTIGQDASTLASRGGEGVAFSGSALTVLVDGFYMVFASIQTEDAIDAGGASYVRLLLGGDQNVGTGRMFPLAPGSSGSSAFMGYLEAGTSIEVQVANGSETATKVSSGSIAVGGVA